MIGGKNIIDLREAAQPGSDDGLIEELLADTPVPAAEPFVEEVEEPRSIWRWLAPLLAGLAALGWITAAGLITWPALARGIDPLQLVNLIAAACVPLVLIAAVWLLAMRNSRAEARRFGRVAQSMRSQSMALEAVLARVSAQIAENQAQLSAQTSAIAEMGDRATERLSAITHGMANEVARADAQARTYTAAVTEAQQALGVLLASLPRAQEETRAMAQAIGAAGLEAGERAAALSAQLAALAEQGRTADQVTGDAAQKLAAHIARMEATSETASARLLSVTGDMSNAVDALLDRTAGAIDEARKGIATQGDAMLAMLEANQAALDRASRDSIEVLASRIAAAEQVIDRIAERLASERAASDALVRELDHGFQVVEARVDGFHRDSTERNQRLAASISALGGSADAMTNALDAGEAMARKVINTAEDLLTSLDAAAREIDETLPDALTRLEAKIGASRSVVASAKPELLALVTAAESTHDAIEAIAQVVQGQRMTLDQLSRLLNEALAVGRERAQAIGETLDETIGRTHDFAEQAAPRLVEALLRVRDSAATAADRARETLATVIPEAADMIEQASAQAMQRALGGAIEQQLAEIARAADEAVTAAERATGRLDAKLAALGETSALVDARIEEAREEREAAESEGFGRRASLLIEALNSASIDITKSFSVDVADSAWAAYLKGDRGIFTRRAVRLLDTNDARDIARMHDSDPAFREQVNRYIHDFEAMLRAVLAQRDGSPMGVTLLSSDMGKLYVALAQAIERLRA